MFFKEKLSGLGSWFVRMLASNRMQSLYWRSGMMILAGMIDSITEAAGMLDLSAGETAFLGLVLGEVSKAINKKLQSLPNS